MIKIVQKLNKPLKGEIVIPSDKSISHRAIMLSSIAEGESMITNFSNGADCRSTLNLFKQLGTEIDFINETTVKILGGKLFPQNSNKMFYCGNSGTTMRLVSGILAGQNFDSILTGDESLSKRPMKRVIEPLSKMGADISSMDGKAPLYINGKKLYGIEYQSKISSAQVKSCILLAALNAEGKTVYEEPNISRNHTELMLKYLGADIETDANKTTILPSKLYSKDIEIVGDISSAAFFIVAGLIVPGSNLIIKNIGINPTRVGILEISKRMGAEIEILNQREVSGELCADIRVKYHDSLMGCEISGEDIPKLIDELPIISVLASQASGETIIKDASDLRNKETDRITCLVQELQKIGVDIFEQEDGFVIYGKGAKKLSGGAELKTYHDHRLAMSFYVAGLICEKDIAIDGFEWINISFPDFEKLFNNLF